MRFTLEELELNLTWYDGCWHEGFTNELDYLLAEKILNLIKSINIEEEGLN